MERTAPNLALSGKPAGKIGTDELLDALAASEAQPERVAFPRYMEVHVEERAAAVFAAHPFP